VEKYGRVRRVTDNTIQRMRNSCWITKATGYIHVLSVCNNYFFSTVAMATRMRLILSHACITCNVF